MAIYDQALNRCLLPPLLAVTRSRFLRLARHSARRQFWDPERLSAWKTKRLAALVRYAVERVPYYRDLMNGDASVAGELRDLAELESWPVLTKQEIEANFPDRIVSDQVTPADLRWHGSGGTTHRIMVINDFAKRDWQRAAGLVSYTADSPYRLGQRMTYIPPDACTALCGVEGLREASVIGYLFEMLKQRRWNDPGARSDLRGLIMNNWIERKLILEPFGPDGSTLPDGRLADYVARLRRHRPRFLKALPEYLLALARYIDRTGDRPPPIAVIKPMGALMSGRAKRIVADVFGTEIREDYGSNDVGPMAFDCREADGLHLLEDHYHFEFQRDGRPVTDDGPANLLVTDLNNRAMPLIRYRIEDVVTVNRQPCRCGRKTPRIVVEGRLEDTLVTPAAGAVTARQICDLFYGCRDVVEFQLTERPSRFDLQLVTAKSDPREDELTRAFQLLVHDSRPLKIRRVASIAPEASGKFRHVKSRSFEDFDLSRRVDSRSRRLAATDLATKAPSA